MILQGCVHSKPSESIEMLVTEIIQCKFLCCDFVHRRAGIGDRTDLIGVELFPPIQWGGDVEIDSNHPHEFTVVCAGVAEGCHQLLIIRTNTKLRVIKVTNRDAFDPLFSIIPMAIALLPGVFRVSHTTNSVLPTENFDIFNFQHLLLLFLTPHCALQVHRERHSPHRKT